MKNYKQSFKTIKYLHNSSPSFILMIIIFSIITSLITVSELLVVKIILNCISLQKSDFIHIVIQYCIYISALLICYIINNWIWQVYQTKSMAKIRVFMKNIIFKKSKTLDISCFEDTVFYDKFTRALDNVEFYITQSVLILSKALMSFITMIFVVTIINDIVITITIGLLVIKSLFIKSIGNKNGFEWGMALTPINRRLDYADRIFSLKQYSLEIKIFNIDKLIKNCFNTTISKAISVQKKFIKKNTIIQITSYVISNIIEFIIYVYLCYKIFNNKLNIGDLMFSFNAIFIMVDNIASLFSIVPDLKLNNQHIQNLNEILDYEPKIKENSNGTIVTKSNFSYIELKNCYFSYPCNENCAVLKNISLKIKKGSKIAIVGHNGSGKSTLIKLLMNLYEVDKGIISCNGIEYNKHNTESLRSLFSVVFQDFQMYALTILENILMREKESDDDEEIVWEALKFSGLIGKVKTFENGINTILTREFDDNGVLLSGGEQQKLAIARAYAQNRPFLILDEPSSALDPLAEKEIYENFTNLSRSKTVIYISHRLSSTVDADCIYLFNNGEITEYGNHKTLMNKQGLYYQMFTSQAENYLIMEGNV